MLGVAVKADNVDHVIADEAHHGYHQNDDEHDPLHEVRSGITILGEVPWKNHGSAAK